MIFFIIKKNIKLVTNQGLSGLEMKLCVKSSCICQPKKEVHVPR